MGAGLLKILASRMFYPGSKLDALDGESREGKGGEEHVFLALIQWKCGNFLS